MLDEKQYAEMNNTNEGIRRIRLLAKRTMLYGALAGLSLWALKNVLYWLTVQGPGFFGTPSKPIRMKPD